MSDKKVSHLWRERFWRYAPLIFWTGAILIASSNTGSMSNTSRFVRPILEFLFPTANEAFLQVVHAYIRKTGHFTGYAILAWLSARAFQRSHFNFLQKRWLLAAFVLTILIATIDEANQSFNSARTGSIYDVLLDAAGGLTALFFVNLIKIWKAPRRSARDI